ncbi:MAG: 50S ribosomal protein L11 methyltransferase [Pseudobdellovibrionaceae bacterium]|nr:50S ribosomal protein L11 methyltransferase [Bdellovibrionales bacterium]USN46469.1 MAG: 50S ribosomal protein L11 methyltransferase [Pseudobdellovibrionaceae bacterium]
MDTPDPSRHIRRMSESYLRVTLVGVDDQDEEFVSDLCFQFGASGITEKLSYVQDTDTFAVTTLPTSTHDLEVYFESKPSEDFYFKLQGQYPGVTIETHEEPHKDWLAEWKKGFRSFRLADEIWVVPSWLETPAEAKSIIKMDPGLAFGTGTHATTQLMSQLLSEYPQWHNQPSILDVGTGTGILSILSVMLGASQVMATEIDELARQTGRENVVLNGVDSKINVIDEQVDEIDQKFDIVVANIIDGILVQISSHLKRALNPGGHLFLTGILLEREKQFLDRFGIDPDFSVLKRLAKDEWVGFELVKKG